jgi:hypothetical protein
MDGPRNELLNELTDAFPDLLLLDCLLSGTDPRSPDDPVAELDPVWDLRVAGCAAFTADLSGKVGPGPRQRIVKPRNWPQVIREIVRLFWNTPPSRSASPVPPAAPAITAQIEIDEAKGAGTAAVTIPGDELPGFEVRAFWTPKRGNSDAQWEDGFAVDARAGLLAVADGAGDGVFTKTWVELLLASYLAQPLPLDELDFVEPWLEERRRAWLAAIRYPELRWSLQKRVDTSCGAATFLAFRLDPDGFQHSGERPGTLSWTAWAVGDVCLFHVRDDRLITTFPLHRAGDFSYAPPLYQSKAWLSTPVAKVLRGDLRRGDLLLFATDALSKQMMSAIESGQTPRWKHLLDIDAAEWKQEIENLRDRGEIINDDCTLLVLQLPRASHRSPDS